MWTLNHIGDAHCVVHPGIVRGKARPRFSRGRTYNVPSTMVAQDEIARAWRAQVGTLWADFKGKAILNVAVQRELAASNPKYWEGRQDLGKPDIDNILKLVMDALNGLAWTDDTSVASVSITKFQRVPHGTGNQILIDASYYVEQFQKEETL